MSNIYLCPVPGGTRVALPSSATIFKHWCDVVLTGLSCNKLRSKACGLLDDVVSHISRRMVAQHSLTYGFCAYISIACTSMPLHMREYLLISVQVTLQVTQAHFRVALARAGMPVS